MTMTEHPRMQNWRPFVAGITALTTALVWPSLPALDARQAPASCAMTGKIISGTTPLPGVSVTASADGRMVAATSTAVDGSYKLAVPPGAQYQLVVEMTAFAHGEQTVTLGVVPCDQKTDFALVLASRVPNFTPAAPVTAPAAPAPAGRGTAQRFSAVDVQANAAAAAALEVTPPDRQTEQATMALLPPGFSTEVPTEAVAINGQMASIDRGMMGDRLGAINRGEFDPATGTFAGGTDPAQGAAGAPGGRGGRGGQAGPGGPGGRGGAPGDFAIGGRGGRGQSPFQATMNYSFSGSALDSAPYQLRPDSTQATNPYNRQNFGATIGGPVIIPGIYNGTRRTTFTVTYGGNRGANLFDQYATVPTAAQRAGDFSSLQTPLINPATGQPFTANQIPSGQINPASTALLRFIPLPNLDGTTRNFHYVTTRDSSADNVTVRLTHNFTPLAARGGGGGRAGGGGAARGGGPGGRGNQALAVNMTAQVQYRRNDNEQANVLPALGGGTTGSTLAVPITINISKNRVQHAINLNYSRTTSGTSNHFSFVEDVAGNAGITGVSADPLTWGVPALSFSTFSSVRDTTPSSRNDSRWSLSYAWTKPLRLHTLRIGGDLRHDLSRSQSDGNAQGAFVFTGLYSSGSAQVRGGGYDFADFLLGLPQQATVNYGPGEVSLRGRSMSLYVQDDWRKSANLTLNLGIRYELVLPFVETNGRMVNLDAAPGFSAVAPVVSGASGPFSGQYPDGLIRADGNNIAPRVGFAWRVAQGTIVRGGYGISYNAGAYSSMARQMVGQPPFSVTNTAIGTATAPLLITAPMATASPTQITNDYGVDADYVLGMVQTLNADISRDLTQVWNVGASYTHIRGSNLDIVRAPNRGPDGLLLANVQPFLWQSAEGSSRLHAAEFRLTRRPVRGVGGGVTYTLARSRDNASTMGGGGTVVAQNDKDLAAEWGRSSFDRRHQMSANLNVDLPFGTGRRFFTNGGIWGQILGGWRFTTNFTWQSGTPLTVRVTGAASNVAQGTNGTLRANYDGSSISIANPTIDQFFNTSAFSIPVAGAYGNSPRNLVVGPGSRMLNGQLSRDVRLGGTRVLSLQLNANNVLNTVNYGGVNTVVNSPSFGQITSVRPMRSMTFNVRFRF
jgi:hypothetical protein